MHGIFYRKAFPAACFFVERMEVSWPFNGAFLVNSDKKSISTEFKGYIKTQCIVACMFVDQIFTLSIYLLEHILLLNLVSGVNRFS